MPDAPRIFTSEYYERLRDLEERFWWNAGMRDVAALLLRQRSLPAAGLLLDIGCGSGQTMTWFRSLYPGWRTIGLDVALDALRSARTHHAAQVTLASALDLPVSTRSVDLVVTLDVLQHLPLDGGDRRSLREMSRVLKPGGHLLVRTNAQSFPIVGDDPQFNFHKYGQRELRAKLEAAGFAVLRLGRLNALLGLAEIPNALRADRGSGSYHGLQATLRRDPPWWSALKRLWLRLEGGAVARGYSWPLGRTMIALCQRP